MLPIRCKNPPESIPFTTYGLILINIIVYLATTNGLTIHDWAVEQYALYPEAKAPFTFVSSMFLHGDLFHLLGNMWFLFLFGSAVEGRMKLFRFIPFYFIAGFAGDFLQLALTKGDIPSLGASGAIMGCVGASLVMFPHAPVTFLWRWGLFDWPMWGACLYYIGFDIVLGILSMNREGGGVGHFAHVGGAFGGALITMLLRMPIDSKELAQAKESIADGISHTGLFFSELDEMAKVQVNNPSLTMAWLQRASVEGKPITLEMKNRFQQQLPQIMAKCAVKDYAGIVTNLTKADPSYLSIRERSLLATRCEKQGEPGWALQLFDGIYTAGNANHGDREDALFRMAQIHEQWFQNYEAAYNNYAVFCQSYPMSPMYGIAKSSMARLENRR